VFRLATVEDARHRPLLLTAALRYVFDDLRLHRVGASYLPQNERSGRPLWRLGFVHILTSLTNPDWRESDE